MLLTTLNVLTCELYEVLFFGPAMGPDYWLVE